jgi:MFS family permease
MNMFNAISIQLLHDFNINATELGTMSAYYFIANVIFLFPAGILLDRFSTRRVIQVTLALCVIGTALFALSPNIAWATTFRFLTGIGSAFCFLSCIRLASRWFPPKNMALITGCIVTMAMLGGLTAQVPFELLVEHFNWRQAVLIDAAFGAIVLAVVSLVVKDYPQGFAQFYEQYRTEVSELGFWQSMRMAFLRRANWLAGIYTCLMNLPLVLLGGLWGTLYLVNAHGITKIDAVHVTSMLFIGTIIGSPISGWVSDRLAKRRLPMIVGAASALLMMMVLIYYDHLNRTQLLSLFFILGLLTSTQIISYPFVAETSPKMITAMSVSVINITTQGGIALFQPLFGFLLDLHAHTGSSHKLAFTVSDFNWAMWIFPIGLLIALIAVYAVNEGKRHHGEL